MSSQSKHGRGQGGRRSTAEKRRRQCGQSARRAEGTSLLSGKSLPEGDSESCPDLVDTDSTSGDVVTSDCPDQVPL